MSTGPPGALQAGGKPGAVDPAGARGSLFALPARTSFRFALLIAAVAASSIMVYEGIYLATPRGSALLAGLAALGVLAGVLYLVQPWWLRRRMRLSPPGSRAPRTCWAGGVNSG
jgi:hypothetical protein